MTDTTQVPTEVVRRSKPFDACPTIRVLALQDRFKYNLQQWGFAGVADSLAGDMSSFWEKGVLDTLTALSSPACYAARCVLTEIDWWGKRGQFFVFIIPPNMKFKKEYWELQDDVKPQLRAIKMWLNADSFAREALAEGKGMMADASQNRKGTGDSAYVEFDPAAWNAQNEFRQIADEMTGGHDRCSKIEWMHARLCRHLPGRYGPYGTSPAEVLLHELVHAMRTVKGITDLSWVEPPFNDTFDDFVAVLVTNIHTAERNPAGLRASHDGFTPMPRKWSNSNGFLSDPTNKRWVEYLCRQDPGFCRNLAATSYVRSFNPILFYLKPDAAIQAIGQELKQLLREQL